MVILINSAVPPFVSSSSRSGAASLSPKPTTPCKRELGMHKKGNTSVSSVTFIGESYWTSRAPTLVSLETASQTPSIIKRGFEYMYNKAHGYRLRGGSLYFGRVPNHVRQSQPGVPPHGVAPTRLDSDTPSYSGRWEKHGGALAVGICGDSAKKVLKVAQLISLEEAQQREASRRCRADNRGLKKELRIEREVSRLKREVAEIAWKRAQAREEGNIARAEKEDQEKKMLETAEKRKLEGGPMLTAAVAAKEGGLVVAPTSWIVPLISLDEARHTEKAKRDAADVKSPIPLPLPPPPAVTSVSSLTVNAGNGNSTRLQLISLEEARRLDRTRRLEENAVARTLMHAQAGTGLSHVSLITLVEARKQDALRRDRSPYDGYRPRSSGPMPKSRKPSDPSPSSRPIKRSKPMVAIDVL